MDRIATWFARKIVASDVFVQAIMQVADRYELGKIADDMHSNLQDEYDMQGNYDMDDMDYGVNDEIHE